MLVANNLIFERLRVIIIGILHEKFNLFFLLSSSTFRSSNLMNENIALGYLMNEQNKSGEHKSEHNKIFGKIR